MLSTAVQRREAGARRLVPGQRCPQLPEEVAGAGGLPCVSGVVWSGGCGDSSLPAVAVLINRCEQAVEATLDGLKGANVTVYLGTDSGERARSRPAPPPCAASAPPLRVATHLCLTPPP